jgi:hypothetical protein
MLLWEQEDQARRRDVPDSEIAANNRAIDRYNQARNDAIEAIDEMILAPSAPCRPNADAWMSSETAGSIIDRLSINSLKIHPMRLQAQRSDASPEHRAACQAKVERLQQQRIGGVVHGAIDYYDAMSPRQTFAHWHARFIQWLAQNGYSPEFCTDFDLHREPDLCRRYRLVLSVGHDEYWSEPMRRNWKRSWPAVATRRSSAPISAGGVSIVVDQGRARSLVAPTLAAPRRLASICT